MGSLMLWTPSGTYRKRAFAKEADLEDAIREVSTELFGPNRVYLDVKKKIGTKAKGNIPDGYLIDLSSAKEPILRVVENELAKHDPLRHVAVQNIEFSLAFENAPYKVKSIVKDALQADMEAMKKCESYAKDNNFENVDVLLDRMIHEGEFAALVVIDDLQDKLDSVLAKKFKFGVEVLALSRYANESGEYIYEFEPFLSDVVQVYPKASSDGPLDVSDIDTVVVPAQDEGFEQVFMGEDRWYKVRIHGSMIPKLKYAAVYRVAPTSAITHVAPISSIEPWQDTDKKVINFAEPAQKVGPIRLVSKGKVKPLYSLRYTSYERLIHAKTLDEAF
jgi:hypothetical protein